MPVRFAAARTPARSPLARALARPALMDPANDCPSDPDPILEAALRHFAAHGLGSVAAALDRAGRAADAQDQEAQRHWLEVCAMFDRRAAAGHECA